MSGSAHISAAPVPEDAPAPARDEAPTVQRVLEVPAERLLQDWKQAYDRALAYLEALGVPASERGALASQAVERALRDDAWDAAGGAVAATLHALWTLLPERYPATKGQLLSNKATVALRDADTFLAWRVDAFLSGRFAQGEQAAGVPARFPAEKGVVPVCEGGFRSMPPLARRGMVPAKLRRRFFRRSQAGGPPVSVRRQRRRLGWKGVAIRRRTVLTVLVLIPTVVASGFIVNVLPQQGSTWLEVAIVLFFGALFGWISIGFWTAIFGFFTLIGRRDRFAITNLNGSENGPAPSEDRAVPLAAGARTAIVMPICEEPVDRVFAGLKAVDQSLERAGAREQFHFFVLSDSSDPNTWLKEEEAWAEWCRTVNGFDRIFYRRRRVRLERKSGNIADFCRRWGQRYRYMIMLDADSVMAGETLVRLVQLMERNPDVGMIQTAPTAFNRRSLFARVQQFASRVYGPMFAAGLHYWQLGEGQYWGHNAIIRVAPFMDHCALFRLPGKPPLGGEILSHDFVEAALMGRAGWTLWLAFDLPGSYEETPSSLLDEMKRDRRWCQGNLQHLRLLFTEGFFSAHRALFLNGVLSYVSALLWFAFLTLSTAEAIQNALREPEYFPHGRSLFPEWPVWRPDWALWLVAVIGMILFLPKVLSILLILFKGRNAASYGGIVKLSLSVFLEILLSSLLAPIRMVFHSRFVVQNLLGRTVSWRSAGREDVETSWWEGIRHHGFDTVFASAWGASLFWLNPDYFWWVTPIIAALILSVPLSVYASRVILGDQARARHLFVIPEESNPPPELRDLHTHLEAAQRLAATLPEAEKDAFVRVAVEPCINALHRALLGRRRSLKPAIHAARTALVERALADGPAALSMRERQILLVDPDLVGALHERVWALPDRARAACWGRPGRTACA